MTGRSAAAAAVGRVLRGGAYSNRVIAAEAAGLDDLERRTAHRIGYGTIRWLLRIDRTITEHSNRAQSHVQPGVWDVLRTATWELLFGDIPDAIAVSAAVDTVREMGHPRATGFVNAVLRRVASSGEPPTADRALLASVPKSLLALLDGQWGEARSDRFLAASNSDAPLTLRRRPAGASVDGLRPVPGIQDAFEAREVPEGHVVQDAASTAVGWSVEPEPGESVLDMAAAPGGKTLHLVDQGARVTAADSHERRLARTARRLRHEPVRFVIADGRAAPFPDATFDRVLLDAPCTGLGVLRRRPEIKYRVTPSEVRRLAGLQTAMLREAERVVRAGGLVAYSVCTVTEAETTGVTAGRFSEPTSVPGSSWGDGVLLTPDVTGTDGMFIAVRQSP